MKSLRNDNRFFCKDSRAKSQDRHRTFSLECLERREMLSADQIKFDIDGNGNADALSDGILIIRYLAGFTGDSLTDNAVDPLGTRVTSESIIAELDNVYSSFLDADGNGISDALSDGITIIRYLAGFTGQPLIEDSIAPDATRTTAELVQQYLDIPLNEPPNPGPAPTIQGAESKFIDSPDHVFSWVVDPTETIELQCVSLEGPGGLEIPFTSHTTNNITLGEIAGIANDDLVDGEYRLGVQVRVNGLWSEKAFADVVLDTEDPTISNVSFPQGAETSVGAIYVSYTVSDVNLAVDETTRRESQVFDLVPGLNQVQLVQTDLAGNTTVQDLQVTYEPAFDLSEDLERFRSDLVASNLQLFTFGDGIAMTGVPIDVVDENGQVVDIDNSRAGVQTQTQPTAIGFQIVAYGSIIAGLVPDADQMRDDAINALEQRLDQVLVAQRDHGLLPWQGVDLAAIRDEVAAFDNLNLLESAVATLGLIEATGFNTTERGAELATKLDMVIGNLRTGFAKLVDTDAKLHQTQNLTNDELSAGTIDRLGAEGRGGTALLVGIEQADPETSHVDERTWQNLLLTTALYETAEGRIVEAITPFDGGGFQSLWNTLFLPEQDYEIADVLWNFVVGQLDNANEHGLAGILSASSVPNSNQYQYAGRIGLPQLSEYLPGPDDELLRTDVASLYSLPGAIPLAPEAVVGELKRIIDANPDLQGSKGLFDSKTPVGDVSKIHLAIDQLSIVNGLTNAGQIGTRAFLTNRGLDEAIRDLYASSFEPTYSAPRQWPQPALTAEEMTRFGHPGAFDILAPSNWDPDQFTPGTDVTATISAGTLTLSSSIAGGFAGGRLSQSINPAGFKSLLLHVEAPDLNRPLTFAVKLESDSDSARSYDAVLRTAKETIIEIKFDAADVPTVDIVIFERLPLGIDIKVSEALFLTESLTSN